MAYAQDTSVSVERSRAEIEKLLTRYGADQFITGYDATRAMIGFRCRDRFVRFRLALPQQTEKRRSLEKIAQETRRLWRALCLVVKAKLESVNSGIETFDEAFLPHIVLPDGRTFAESAVPAIAETYRTGKMPPLLGMGSGSE